MIVTEGKILKRKSNDELMETLSKLLFPPNTAAVAHVMVIRVLCNYFQFLMKLFYIKFKGQTKPADEKRRMQILPLVLHICSPVRIYASCVNAEALLCTSPAQNSREVHPEEVRQRE